MNILQKIIAHKRQWIDQRKSLYPVALLEQSIYFQNAVVSLREYLLRPDKSGIIAEFKRKSPSKGMINPYAQVEEVSIGYMQAGASALSILTDQTFFGGQNEDLQIARKFNFCPILRKDFIIDPYQIFEARALGADAILLIAEVLSAEKVHSLASLARSLGLEVLLEIHSAQQLPKICPEVTIVGVNNRNLEDFSVHIDTSLALFEQIPSSFTRISESGISSPEAILQLRQVGFEGFLIGEHFMNASDPAKACRQFIQEVEVLSKALQGTGA